MCVVDGADCDYPSVQTAEFRRAAKPHKCRECSRIIQRGERHQWNSMLFEGKWETWRECPRCVALGSALRRSITAFVAAWEIGGLLEAVRCELNEMTSSEKARFRGLLREERRKALAMRNARKAA